MQASSSRSKNASTATIAQQTGLQNSSGILLVFLSVILLCLLAGCGTRDINTEQGITSELAPEDEAERQIWLAERAPLTERPDYYLQALSIYNQRADFANGQLLITKLAEMPLSTFHYEQFAILAASNAMQQNEPASALLFFENAPPGAFITAPLHLRLQAIELQADALYLSNSYLAAAQIRVFNSGLYTGNNYWHNQDSIWRALRAAPSLGISKALEEAYDYSWRGWLELITAIRQNQFSLEMQLQALQQWQSAWSDHDANLQLPAELAMLSDLPQTRPKKLALILPLTGQLAKVGSAIRDGFLAAYYNDNSPTTIYNDNNTTTIIDIFDSEVYDTVIDQYLELQLAGYDIVIGPLEKEAVRDLALLPQLSPPVLALNYLDDQFEAIDGLYQFGLSADDEVRQIISLLERQEKQYVAVIHPEGEWANSLLAIIKSWAEQSGRPPVLTYQVDSSDNNSDGIADLLQIEASKARAKQLSRVVGKVEFEPRRRGDIDAVILLTSPSQARQIKPLLDFHYASDIPVYASSRIYSGISLPEKDHDLNGILYTEVPWLLSNTSALRADIHYLAGTSHYERLYAMGTDAYLLAPRLQLLTSFPESKVQGATGNLSIDNRLQVRRELEWATFERGSIKARLSQ